MGSRPQGTSRMNIHITDIIFDCADPKRMAEFWAALTGLDIQRIPDGDNRTTVTLGDKVVTTSGATNCIAVASAKGISCIAQ